MASLQPHRNLSDDVPIPDSLLFRSEVGVIQTRDKIAQSAGAKFHVEHNESEARGAQTMPAVIANDV